MRHYDGLRCSDSGLAASLLSRRFQCFLTRSPNRSPWPTLPTPLAASPAPPSPVSASALRYQGSLSNGIPSHEDRKSTRLNSSHGYISYAVFCLKKKKNKRSVTTTHHT